MFSEDYYGEIINRLKSFKFNFSIDWSDNLVENYLLLRHDIDFSLLNAHKIALLESSFGIKSTYFFMLTSNMYNPLSKKNRTLIFDIKDMGHKISLHFDPTVYKNLKSFLTEKNVFETTFETNIDVVSIHRPGPFLNNNDIDLYGTKHTYQNRYFKKMKYISDSGGRDILQPLMNCITNKNHSNGLQLLLHPIWWTYNSNFATETLNNWKENQINFLTQEIRLNCKTYKD